MIHKFSDSCLITYVEISFCLDKHLNKNNVSISKTWTKPDIPVDIKFVDAI